MVDQDNNPFSQWTADDFTDLSATQARIKATDGEAARVAAEQAADQAKAGQRGISVEQSVALDQRIRLADMARKGAMGLAPPGASGQIGYDAAMKAFGPIEPWIASALANERNATGGAPVPSVNGDSSTSGAGVTYDMGGQTVTAQFPPAWRGTFAADLFKEATQDPAHKGSGQYVPSPNLLPRGSTQHSDGLENIGGVLSGVSTGAKIAPIAGAIAGTMALPGIGTAVGSTLGGLYGKNEERNAAGTATDSAGTGAGTDSRGGGVVTNATGGGVAGPGGVIPGAGGERIAPPTVSLATAAADVYAKTPAAAQATQAADVATSKVTAAQAALAAAVTPEQITAARAELAAAVTAKQTVAAQIDQSKQAFFRDFQVKNVGALNDQAEGRGPSLAYALFQKATDENLANIHSQAATARGGNVASAGSAAIYATGNLQARAAQDAGILRLKEQMDARQQLAAALASGRGGDIDLATKQAELDQGTDIANADRTLRADTTNQGNEQATNLANANFEQQTRMQNAANVMAAALAAQKEANENYKFNASEANRVALDNANREVTAAIANQTNARETAKYNTTETNTVNAANAGRELTAATTNQGNTATNGQFNAGQTNSVNVAGYNGQIGQRATDVQADVTMRGQDITAVTDRSSLSLARDKQNHAENQDYIETGAAVAGGLSDAYAHWQANQDKLAAAAKAAKATVPSTGSPVLYV